ncbi:MAG: tetratricopeptide repeat protein [Terriglobia bacterium]
MNDSDSPRQPEWLRNFAGDSRGARALLPAAILAATFLSYLVTLDLGFFSDDQILIITNGSIRSWSYFPSYFTSHIWSYHYPHWLTNAYRPILLIWLRLNEVLFGAHAWGWHLSSLAMHLAVTYLVYRLGLRLTGDVWTAAAGALIFGLHPVHVETIAEVSWADQPLSTLFVLATILTWWRSREAGRRVAWLAGSMVLCTAALLSKESSLVLPVLIGGSAWIFGGVGGREVAPIEFGFFPRLRSALGASIPYWVLILLYLPLRIRALRGFTHVLTPLTLSQEVFTLPSVLLFYLRLLVWPTRLSCFYDTPYISTPGWHDFVLPAALLAAVAAVLALWYGRTRRSAPGEAKAMAFAFLWMMLTLLPVLNFRFLLEGEIAHDRYVYLPSVGFALLVAIALRQTVGLTARYLQPAWLLVGVLALIAAMGMATVRQCLFWSDDLVLGLRAHAIAPHNITATTSLAAAAAKRGMDGQAMALDQQVLAVQPNAWPASRDLAYLYYAHGNFPEAARLFVRSLTVGPEDGDQFLYLGLALLQTGRPVQAEKAVRAALLVRPEGRNYHLGLAMVLRTEGRLPEARQETEVELTEDPQNAQARALRDEITTQVQAEAEKSSAGQRPNGPSKAIK